jgi:cell wall-associated NlpC family hydrolase
VNGILARARSYAHHTSSSRNEACEASGGMPARGAVRKIIAFAMPQRGKRYVFGATGPNAWDCSSLVQAAYRAAG